MKKILLIILIAFCFQIKSANIFYVCNSILELHNQSMIVENDVWLFDTIGIGSDTNTGLSALFPMATIGSARDTAVAGDTILVFAVEGDSYVITASFNKPGISYYSNNAYLTRELTSALYLISAETNIISGFIFKDFEIGNLYFINSIGNECANTIIKNCIIDNVKCAYIFVKYFDDSLIVENCVIQNCDASTAFVFTKGSKGQFKNVIMNNNTMALFTNLALSELNSLSFDSCIITYNNANIVLDKIADTHTLLYGNVGYSGVSADSILEDPEYILNDSNETTVFTENGYNNNTGISDEGLYTFLKEYDDTNFNDIVENDIYSGNFYNGYIIAYNDTFSSQELNRTDSQTLRIDAFDSLSADTSYNILKNDLYSISNCNNDVYDLSDSNGIIGRFAYISQTTDTPTITNKLNGFAYVTGDDINVYYDGYKGAGKVQVKLYFQDDLVTPIQTLQYTTDGALTIDLTSYVSTSGNYYYTFQPIKGN